MHRLTYEQAANIGLAVIGRAVVGVTVPIPSWTDIVDGPVIPDRSPTISGPSIWHDIVSGPLVPRATTN